MKECQECEKKLKIIEGYRHPTLGNNYFLCSKCFDSVSESVNKYKEFIKPYIGFFNNTSVKIENKKSFNNIFASIKLSKSKIEI